MMKGVGTTTTLLPRANRKMLQSDEISFEHEHIVG